MTTALDTNVLVSLWDEQDSLNSVAAKSIEMVSQGRLVVCGAVYAELLAMPRRTEEFVQTFLSELQIEIEWMIDESIWRAAGHAFSSYAARRRKARSGHPRRILTDFLIGAHAATRGYSLLTMDDRLVRAAFPELKLIRV